MCANWDQAKTSLGLSLKTHARNSDDPRFEPRQLLSCGVGTLRWPTESEAANQNGYSSAKASWLRQLTSKTRKKETNVTHTRVGTGRTGTQPSLARQQSTSGWSYFGNKIRPTQSLCCRARTQRVYCRRSSRRNA
jgi:hypothetical protein